MKATITPDSIKLEIEGIAKVDNWNIIIEEDDKIIELTIPSYYVGMLWNKKIKVTIEAEIEKEIPDKTEMIHQWMKDQNDDIKQRLALNWNIPHSIFNCMCRHYTGGSKELQNVDWFRIHQSKDIGNFSHGGKVFVL